MPVVCRSGSLKRALMVKQNWIAASENIEGRPLCGASQVISLSSQISSDPSNRMNSRCEFLADGIVQQRRPDVSAVASDQSSWLPIRPQAEFLDDLRSVGADVPFA